MKIGFIGAGKMAGAIINGILSSNILNPEEIGVYDINPAACEAYAKRGFQCCDSIAEISSTCAYVVLSVKPQNFSEVISAMKPYAHPDTVFVTIMAGISAEAIKEGLGLDAKVIRVMPNTPLLVGYGSIALSRMAPVTEEEFTFIKQVFAAAGEVEEILSTQMNEVIPLNGSSPAYIYLFAKIFVERAVKLGFDAKVANRLFCNTLIGSAKMMMETGKSHQELIDMVTSKGGTTFAGLQALSQSHFEQALDDCFDATIQRAYELGT